MVHPYNLMVSYFCEVASRQIHHSPSICDLSVVEGGAAEEFAEEGGGGNSALGDLLEVA